MGIFSQRPRRFISAGGVGVSLLAPCAGSAGGLSTGRGVRIGGPASPGRVDRPGGLERDHRLCGDDPLPAPGVGAEAGGHQLAELASALGDDPNFAATIAASIADAKQRSNHLGTQLASTISDLTATVDTQILGKMAVADVGDGSATTFTVTHSLGTRDLHVQVRQAASPWSAVMVDWRPVTVNAIELAFLTAPAASAYRVMISRAG